MVSRGATSLQLTLHIGPHKTGTTALQSAFARGARPLRRKGVLYPKTNWLYPAQHRLAFALKGKAIPGTGERPDRKAEMAELKAAIGQHAGDRVFLSSEELFSCNLKAVTWLRDQLDIADVRILTFLRRPDMFLVSSYNQKIRQAGNGFDAPIRRFVRDPRKIAPEIDYQACLGAWADVFGDAAICLETYEDAAPLGRTLKHLGLPPRFLPDQPGVNKSVPGAVAECMRHAKAIGMAPEHQRRVLKRATSLFGKYPPFVLSNEDRLHIIRMLEPSNSALFQRFGRENPYTAEGYKPVPQKQDFNLSQQDLMRLIGCFL